MIIPIALSGSGPFTDLQLSFRDNAGTRGDAQGTIPVILFTGSFAAGTYTLEIALQNVGSTQVVMGLKATDNTAKPTMYESEWIIVP
jgi:hypothetical protein